MADFNRVILMGRLTRDVELRYVGSGIAVTDVGLAVNDRRKNAEGQWIEETTFVDVTLWGRTAEVASQYLTKGSPAFFEGRLKFDTWDTPDGQKRSKLRVVAERMQFLPRGTGGSQGGGGPARDANEYSQPVDDYESGPPGGGAEVGGNAGGAPPASGSQPQQGDDIPF